MVAIGHKYQPPNFCDSCGAPHPWAGRDARIYQLENMLDEQELDEATRLRLIELLEDLRNQDLDEEEQKKRWAAKINELSPGLVQAGTRIIESVVSAGIKRMLGI